MENIVLFISSNPYNRQIAKKALKGRFELDVPKDTEGLLSKPENYFCVITLDFTTLPPKGLELFKKIKAHFKCRFLGITNSISGTKRIWKDDLEIDDLELKEIEPCYLQRDLQEISVEIEVILKIINKNELKKMAKLIDKRDIYSQNHLEEIKDLALGIGNLLNLDKRKMEKLEIMSMLHDIGRVGYRKEIKKIMLEMEETTNWKLADLITNLDRVKPGLTLVDLITNLDRVEPGLGHYYQIFLSQERIKEGHLLSEIIAIADAYDFLVNSDFLKKGLSPEEAIDSIKRTEKFDSNITNALWRAADNIRFLKEKTAYHAIEDSIKEKYYGKFVAILNKGVVGVGEDSGKLAMEVYEKYGYVTTYITQVGVEPTVIEVSSPERGV